LVFDVCVLCIEFKDIWCAHNWFKVQSLVIVKKGYGNIKEIWFIGMTDHLRWVEEAWEGKG
jgi:hypothetical protein